MGFSRQEYWSGLPFPSPGHLSNPGIEPMSPVSPALQADSLSTEPLGNYRELTNYLCSGKTELPYLNYSLEVIWWPLVSVKILRSVSCKRHLHFQEMILFSVFKWELNDTPSVHNSQNFCLWIISGILWKLYMQQASSVLGVTTRHCFPFLFFSPSLLCLFYILTLSPHCWCWTWSFPKCKLQIVFHQSHSP